MFLLALKRLIVMLMSFAAMLSSLVGQQKADSTAGHVFPQISAEEQAEDTVRVMSFNIRCADVNGVAVRERLDIGARQILEIMPDTLGIQEATPEWMRALDLRLLPYDWVGVDRDCGGDPKKGGESCPIFYLKAKFKALDSGYFWLSETPDVPSFGPGAACRRICTWVKLQDRKTGEVFVHVNSHFDHVSREARLAGAKILTDYIQTHFDGLNVVFTADMNALRTEEAYTVMTADLADAQLIAADAKSAATFHGGSPETHQNSTIDFILCPATATVSSFRVVTKGVDGRFTSDHFPLYADMRFAR